MKQLLVFLLLLCSASVSAQDVIVKKDGSTIVCRVVEVSANEITYKKWSDLNGSNYVMDKSLASAINYESGKKESFSEATNLYTPNNQNDGSQQLNDRALLKLDYNMNEPIMKKPKTYKLIGWIGGGLICAAGIAIYQEGSGHNESDDYTNAGALAIAGGAAWALAFNLIAKNQQKKNENRWVYSTLYQYDIPISNNSFLSLGADLLSDRTMGNHTIGLGLRYNF